jgi:hypothetical protein
MATAEEGLFFFLNVSPALRALTFTSGAFFDGTNCRVYPGQIDENSILPALAFVRVGGHRMLTMGGVEGLVRGRFQFTAAGTIYDDPVVLMESVISLLDGFRGSFPNGVIVQVAEVVLDPFDEFSAEARLFSRHCDFEIVYQN